MVGGALRRLRQYTREKLDATSWASRAAIAVFPMPPMPSSAASRHRSGNTHAWTVASSLPRPTKSSTSGAPSQSWSRSTPSTSAALTGGTAGIPSRACSGACCGAGRSARRASSHTSSNGVRMRGASRSTAPHSSCASAASRPTVRPPASSSTLMSACSRSALGLFKPASQSWTVRRLTPRRAASSRWVSPVRPRWRSSRPRKDSAGRSAARWVTMARRVTPPKTRIIRESLGGRVPRHVSHKKFRLHSAFE